MRVERAPTPVPNKSEAARLRNVVLPTRRPRKTYAPATTVAGILDSPPTRCTHLRAWRSGKKGVIGMRRVVCGRWDCPNCVVDRVVETFAPAWAYWHGAADRIEFPNEDAWHNARRRKYDVRMRGERADPGVVSMPAAGSVGRVVWAPAGRLDGDGITHRGTALDEKLIADIRAMPLPGRDWSIEGGKPPTHLASFRDDPQRVKQAAAVVGLHIDVRQRGYVVVPGSEEQWESFKAAMGR
ncbi:MAG TPA: hypothetical protein VGN09_13480 [Vicinamibacteria bacterium]|jgi:hypothetical protein